MEQLKARVENGEWGAILEIGTLGDRAAIPYLKELMDHPNKAAGGPASNARIALAKLGEQDQFRGILAALTSDDPRSVTKAAFELAYVGGDQAVVALGSLLESPTGYRRAKDSSDEVFEPPSHLAAKALSQLVPDGPVSLKLKSAVTSEHLAKWRKWWKDNRLRFEETE